MKKQRYLICYDITDPKRLNRVFNFLKKRALHVQYSIFMGRYHPAEYQSIVAHLRKLINPKTDDVRLYPLPEKLEWISFGRPLMPEAIYFLGQNAPPMQHQVLAKKNLKEIDDEPLDKEKRGVID